MNKLITLQELSCEEHFTLLLKANATLENGLSTSTLTFVPYCLRNHFDSIEMGIGKGFAASGVVQGMRTEVYSLREPSAIKWITTFMGRSFGEQYHKEYKFNV